MKIRINEKETMVFRDENLKTVLENLKKQGITEVLNCETNEIIKTDTTIKERLEYLRGEIEKECISTEEVAELESLKEYIEPGDTVLLEWAGVPEFND